MLSKRLKGQCIMIDIISADPYRIDFCESTVRSITTPFNMVGVMSQEYTESTVSEVLKEIQGKPTFATVLKFLTTTNCDFEILKQLNEEAFSLLLRKTHLEILLHFYGAEGVWIFGRLMDYLSYPEEPFKGEDSILPKFIQTASLFCTKLQNAAFAASEGSFLGDVCLLVSNPRESDFRSISKRYKYRQDCYDKVLNDLRSNPTNVDLLMYCKGGLDALGFQYSFSYFNMYSLTEGEKTSLTEALLIQAKDTTPSLKITNDSERLNAFEEQIKTLKECLAACGGSYGQPGINWYELVFPSEEQALKMQSWLNKHNTRSREIETNGGKITMQVHR